MIRVALCDDDLLQLNHTQSVLNRYKQDHLHYEIAITTFSAPLELLSYVEKNGGFDLYLMDVYMMGILGTEAAQQLRQMGDKGEIIFLTSSREHAIDAFEVDAVHYLTKPYTESSLFTALDKVFDKLRIERRHFITLKTAEGRMRLFIRDVVFIESGKNNYQVIHMINKDKIEVRMTSIELFELLSTTRFFVRCGVSIILNLKYVRQITKDTITFDTGEHINYPYRAYPKLKEVFLSFQVNTER